MTILLRQVKIADTKSPFNGLVKDILLLDHQIISISDKYKGEADQTIELKNAFVSPGFVDPFVHFCDPGMEHKETVESGLDAVQEKLSINNLSYFIGGRALYENAALHIKPKDKIGLVGLNGTGKSTLLKIINGDIQPSSGEVQKAKDCTIGFLNQDLLSYQSEDSILDVALEAFKETLQLEQEIENVLHQMETDHSDEIVNKLARLQDQFEANEGYTIKAKAEEVLEGIGFQTNDLQKPLRQFSGGWRMRIELAKLLLQSNDVLLLDEPTNHLDIESIIWLEQFLRNYIGVVVIVSHDKMFLDNVTNRTIEISLGKAYDFNKPYSEYLVLRQEIREKQLATQKNQAKKIEETEKLIEKFRAKASKASMAQSLIKKLDKVERIEVDEDDNSVMNISFPVSQTPGRVVIEAEHVTKAYGDKTILKDISLLVERGSKVAFVGQNGQGKSTFMKAIVNEFEYEGSIKLGHNVQLGYFAQNQAEYLDGEITLLQTMEEAATDTNRSKVRDMLGSFLFRGDDVEKKVKVLSGGERNRLALCKLLLQPINVLVMDEPTNHLDIKSKNVLKAALKQFEGTLLLVSHDRDFLQGMSNIVYEFKDQKIREYLGDINFFLEQKNAMNMREIEKKEVVSNANTNKAVKNISYEDQKKAKSLQNRLSKIESQIQQLEKDIQLDDKALASNYDKHIEDATFFAAYEKKKKELEQLLEDWENVQLEIEMVNS